MIGVYVILLILLILIAWVLFIPVKLVCGTKRSIYKVRQPYIFDLQLVSDGRIRFVGSVFGIRLKPSKPAQPKPKGVQRKRSKFSNKTFAQWKRLVRNIFSALRTRRFRIDLDTGDSFSTALLIPAGMWVSQGPVTITGNFEGRVEADIELSFSVYKIAWAFLRFII
jgi:hypothetical protein